MRVVAALSLLAVATVTGRAAAALTPDLGPNVIVLDPASADAQQKIDDLYATQEAGQFNDRRAAVVFKPGGYHLDVKVGFYTQVLGLGRVPDDVAIVGAVRSTAGWMNGNATCNFWRSAENLSVAPAPGNGVNVWAVSQATALRRVHVKGGLNLWDGGWSSGGFVADSRVDGTVASGSQQQWMSRNSAWGRWQGGAYNMVFVGVPSAPAGAWPAEPYTTVDAAPVVREKPYLTLGDDGRYAVVVPGLRRDARGPTWPDEPVPSRTLTADALYVARADRDTAATLNAALAAGKHLLMTPGIYRLAGPLRVARPGTVVLGIGYATLRPTGGTAAVEVDDVDGVTLAGLLLDAGAVESPTLLRVGPAGAAASHADAPTALFDIACRVGGAGPGRAASMVTINSRHVLGDNLWLWRADHGEGAGWTRNTNANGLIVDGDDVTIYGLFVEHSQQYQTLWNANGGRVYFYQSEFPYDPPSQAAWGNGGRGYASYKVADGVTTHEAYGLGIYCVFLDAACVAQNAVETPDGPGIRIRNTVVMKFAGKDGSGTAHVINGRGGDSRGGKPVRVQ